MEFPSNKFRGFPEVKKTLKRPPFSTGYGNLKPKIQKPIASETVKKPIVSAAPSFKRNPLLTKRRSSLVIHAQKKTFQRSNIQQRNVPNVTVASKFAKTKVPAPKVEPSVVHKPDTEIPDLNSEVWQLIVQWCQQHTKSLNDFSSFSSFSSKPAFVENKKFAFRPACKYILEKCNPKIENRLETLLGYLKQDNFPSPLMFSYLSKQVEKCANLTEYSLFWIILAECKLAERTFDDVARLLQDSYKCKAKPPGRIIECYQRFVGLLMEPFLQQNDELLAKADNAENELVLSNLKIPVTSDDAILIEIVKKTELNDDLNSSQAAIIIPETASSGMDQKEFFSATSESFEANKQSVDPIFATPRRKSVAFADPIFADLGQLNLTSPMQPETLQMDLLGDSIIINQFENKFAKDESEFLAIPDSAKSTTANRRTDLFDHSQMFLSSQRKYALFTENNENYPGSKPFVTPVRRSTRVDQENLPVELREKLTLFDSPSEFETENCEVRRNPALRASFGGKVIKEALDSLDKN